MSEVASDGVLTIDAIDTSTGSVTIEYTVSSSTSRDYDVVCQLYGADFTDGSKDETQSVSVAMGEEESGTCEFEYGLETDQTATVGVQAIWKKDDGDDVMGQINEDVSLKATVSPDPTLRSCDLEEEDSQTGDIYVRLLIEADEDTDQDVDFGYEISIGGVTFDRGDGTVEGDKPFAAVSTRIGPDDVRDQLGAGTHDVRVDVY